MTTENDTPVSPSGPSPPDPDRVPQYEICVAGHIASRWSAWFDGLTIETREDGTTVIRGPAVDQAALHGLIQKLRDVGIPLISLTQIPSGQVPPRTQPIQVTTEPRLISPEGDQP